MLNQEFFRKLGKLGCNEMVTMATLENESNRWRTKAASLEVTSGGCGNTLKPQCIYSHKNLSISTANVTTPKEVEARPHLRGLPIPGTTTEDVC